MIQVIVMIMGDDDHLDWRQLVDADRWLVKPLRSGERERGRPIGEHRVRDLFLAFTSYERP